MSTGHGGHGGGHAGHGHGGHPTFDLKPLSAGGRPAALEKAKHYRLLNEPFEAESICRDILLGEPDHRDAIVTLILAITDQFASEGGSGVSDARDLLERLADPFDQAYYAGIICERRGEAYLHRVKPGTGPVAYDWLRRAMAHYEEAEAVRPEGNDDPILRWNTCARLIMRHPHLAPGEHTRPPMLE